MKLPIAEVKKLDLILNVKLWILNVAKLEGLMNFDSQEGRKVLRIVCDREDWPSQGAGWIMVPMPADPRDIDVLLVSREGPVADLAEHGVPIVAAPDMETPLRLLKVASGAVFVDDAPEAIHRVLRRACRA